MKNLLAHGADEIFMAAQLCRDDRELGPLVAIQKVEYRVYLVVHRWRQAQDVSVCYPL